MWEMATSDPHLMRLGDWLLEKEKETHANKWSVKRWYLKNPSIWDLKEEDTQAKKYDLERKFLNAPSISDLKVIEVECPNYNVKVPFVEIWSSKEASHANCAFAKHMTGQPKAERSAAPVRNLIPGKAFKEQEDNEKQMDFKPWEEWEKGGRMDSAVFSWKAVSYTHLTLPTLLLV